MEAYSCIRYRVLILSPIYYTSNIILIQVMDLCLTALCTVSERDSVTMMQYFFNRLVNQKEKMNSHQLFSQSINCFQGFSWLRTGL